MLRVMQLMSRVSGSGFVLFYETSHTFLTGCRQRFNAVGLECTVCVNKKQEE